MRSNGDLEYLSQRDRLQSAGDNRDIPNGFARYSERFGEFQSSGGSTQLDFGSTPFSSRVSFGEYLRIAAIYLNGAGSRASACQKDAYGY
jgi:hypothetical protein